MNEYFEIEEIDEDSWRIRNVVDYLYIYILRGAEKTLVIDTAYGIGSIRDCVQRLTGQPQILINTHGHPDHIYGNVHFDSALIHSDDIALGRMFYDKEVRKSWFPPLDRLPEGFSEEEWNEQGFDGFTPIEDGHVLDLGGRRLRAIHTPGHSPGSIALYDESRKYLFTGDSIILGDVWLNCPESSTMEVFLASLRKLQACEVEQVFPSHMKESMDRAILDEMVEAASVISDGTKPGVPHDSLFGPTLRYAFDRFSILYGKPGSGAVED